MSRLLTRVKAIAVAALLTIGFVTVSASGAAASGSACHWSHGAGGQTCLGVDGTGYQVNWVRVSHHDGYGIYNYCGFKSKFEGRLTTGAWYSATFGYTSGCTPAPYYNNHDVNNYFRKGLNVQGQTYHDGQWVAGVPTIAIQ